MLSLELGRCGGKLVQELSQIAPLLQGFQSWEATLHTEKFVSQHPVAEKQGSVPKRVTQLVKKEQCCVHSWSEHLLCSSFSPRALSLITGHKYPNALLDPGSPEGASELWKRRSQLQRARCKSKQTKQQPQWNHSSHHPRNELPQASRKD